MHFCDESGWEPWNRLNNRTSSGIQAQQQSITMRLKAIKTFNSRKHKLLYPKRPESPARNIHLPSIRKSKFQLFYRPKPSKKSYSLLLDYKSPLPEEVSSNQRPNLSHTPIFSTILEDYTLQEENKLKKGTSKHIQDSYRSLNSAFKAPIEGLEGSQIPIKSNHKIYQEASRLPSKFKLLTVNRNRTPLKHDNLTVDASKLTLDKHLNHKNSEKSTRIGYYLLRNSMDTPSKIYHKLRNPSRNLSKEEDNPTVHKRGKTEIGISTDP